MDRLKRNSNIELLRILSIVGVIILHYNLNNAFPLMEKHSLNYYFLLFLESVFCCAVDVFMIISGMFSIKRSEVNCIKPVMLLAQVSFVQIVAGIIGVIFNGSVLSFSSLVRMILPVNYFVVLYSATLILSPFLNRLLQGLSKEQFFLLLKVLFVIISIIPYVIDSIEFLFRVEIYDLSTISRYGSGYGYSLVNFVMMYIVGAYIGRFGFGFTIRKSLITLLSLWCVLTLLGLLGDIKGYGTNFAYSYCSPLVILSAVVIVSLFVSLPPKQVRLVNFFAKSSFSVYLVQGHCLKYVNASRFANNMLPVLVLHIVCICIIIYCIGMACDYIWSKIEVILKPIKNLASKIRITAK